MSLRRPWPFAVNGGQAPCGEPVACGLAEQEVLGDIDLSHDQSGEAALVEEDLGGLGVAPVDGGRVSIPEVHEVAEGAAEVVPSEGPASQERRGVRVGHGHGPAGLPEPAQRASMVKSCRRARGLNPLGLDSTPSSAVPSSSL